MKKMLMMATTAAMIEQFNKNNILILEEMGYEVHVAGNFKQGNPISEERLEQFKLWLGEHHAKWFDIPSTRKPTDINNIKAYKIIVGLINKYNYDFIHCHTPIGSVIARCAAHKTQVPIIYTAHGFHFYKGAPLINWMIYYPVEKWLARYTDILITINKEDYERAKSFKAGKVCYVPGVGIDLKKFNVGYVDKDAKRKEIGVASDDFVLLSVGELIPRKNHEVVIRAIGELKKRNQLSNIQYVICGKGKSELMLRKLSEELEVAEHVHFLGYRTDISEICNCSDLFMFMSLQEELPVALMEAMACGLPAICSDIRGNTDLIKNDETGYIVENTPESIADAIIKLSNDSLLRNRLSSNALYSIKHYDLSNIQEEMTRIYGVGVILTIKEIYKGQKIRNELGIPLEAQVILSVGEVNKNKNHQVGIKALARLNNSSSYYVICGKGPLEESNRKLARELGVDNRVIFTGYRTDVDEFYQMADVFLFPSLREGLPVAVIEAMASRLPVVATLIRGSRDLVNKNSLYRTDDIEGISKAMEKVKKPITEYGISEYDIRNVMEIMKEIYNSL